MSRSFTLSDPSTLDDLQVFLARAARIEEGSVRLIAGSGILAVYTAILYPVGLLDETPTVLGLRTAALSASRRGRRRVRRRGADPLAASAARERAGAPRVASGCRPRAPDARHDHRADGGAHRHLGGDLAAARRMALGAAHRSGGARRRRAGGHRRGRGRRARGRWASSSCARCAPRCGAARSTDSSTCPPAPRSRPSASASSRDDEVRLYETGPWTRLTTKRGHVLVKRKAWTLAR